MSKKTLTFDPKELFSELFEHGIDFDNRRIYFGPSIDEGTKDGSVSWESVEKVVRAIHLLSNHSYDPINLYMCSPGGDEYEMLRLYDVIQQCPCQVKFFGSGLICSSAAWIMSGCDERFLDPHTSVMVHFGTWSAHENVTDFEITANELRRLNQTSIEILASNSKMSAEFWYEVCKRDLYLTPEEAITLGLADQIVYSIERNSFRKLRNNTLKNKDKRSLNKLINNIYKRLQIPRLDSITIQSEKENEE